MVKTNSADLKSNLDPLRFSQGLTNILDNALRHTPEEAAHLFDRFYRADESRTRNDGGSGLGLAITKSIIPQD